jgi:CRP-like cAMP-binding protein
MGGMTVERLLRRRQITLDDDERRLLDAAIHDLVRFDGRLTVIPARAPLTVSLYLVSGFMCRYVDDRLGNRQLVSVQIPGDFVDLHGYPLKSLDHDVGTLTAAEVAVFQHAELDRIARERPELMRKLWFSTLLDAAMHREWIFKLGRLPAHGRLAHLLCETNARLRSAGLSDGTRFALPLTQADLAEICGLTSIHVNRVVRDLRERGLCSLRNGVVDLHDLPALARLGEFHPAYLYLDPEILREFASDPARA